MDQINGLVWLCFLCAFSIRSEHLLAYKELQTPVAFGMPFHDYQAKNSGEHSGWVANTPGPATWLLQGVTLLKSSSAPERRVNCSYAPFPPGESAVCSLREDFLRHQMSSAHLNHQRRQSRQSSHQPSLAPPRFALAVPCMSGFHRGLPKALEGPKLLLFGTSNSLIPNEAP